MKIISAEMMSHIQQEITTLCTMWKITRLDNQVFGFTDNTTDLVYNGLNYIASTGHNASNIKTSTGLNVDNLEVTSNLGGNITAVTDVLDSFVITEEDIRLGLWDLAKIEIFSVNYNDLTMGSIIMRTGTIGEIKTGRNQFMAELRGMTQPLSQFIGRLYTPSCLANFGDSKCKKNIIDFTYTGSVSEVLNQHSWNDFSLTQTLSPVVVNITNITVGTISTVITSPGHPLLVNDIIVFSNINNSLNMLNGNSYKITAVTTNTFTVLANTFGKVYTSGGYASKTVDSEFFQGGLLTWTSGLNNGVKIEVRNYYPSYIFIVNGMLSPIQNGDTYTITTGCDKRIQTCNDRYSNVINFRGFNLVPGQDKLTSGK